MDELSFPMVLGLGGSGQEHWQSLWRRDVADARVVEQANWDRPNIETWLAVLNRAMAACRKPIVLVVHSLGCALVAHWVGTAAGPIDDTYLLYFRSVNHPNRWMVFAP